MEVYGHRGAAAHEPENTLRSIKEALRQNVDIVEIDVYALRTGELVVIHDEDVDRTTNGHGAVMKMRFEELRSLDAGKGEKIPTLDEVVELINGQVPLNIELKGPDTAEPTANSLKSYFEKSSLAPTDFLVSSFNHNELEKFHKLLPDIQISALFDKIPDNFAEIAQRVGASIISPRARRITKEIVDEAKANGLEVTAWTVDDGKQAKKLSSIGLKGVFSNDPIRIKTALETS
jgi:glycerophosphoryl diester phosphodiesterase